MAVTDSARFFFTYITAVGRGIPEYKEKQQHTAVQSGKKYGKQMLSSVYTLRRTNLYEQYSSFRQDKLLHLPLFSFFFSEFACRVQKFEILNNLKHARIYNASGLLQPIWLITAIVRRSATVRYRIHQQHPWWSVLSLLTASLDLAECMPLPLPRLHRTRLSTLLLLCHNLYNKVKPVPSIFHPFHLYNLEQLSSFVFPSPIYI